MALTITLNGQTRSFEALAGTTTLPALIAALELKSDRIALERNGEIVSRADWASTSIESGDKLEIVHFVGGGLG